MTRAPAIPGVVLAGGASRRMGRDKALVPLGGRPLVLWTVERLARQCGALAVSRHDGRLDGLDLGLPLLADAGHGPASAAGAGAVGGPAGARIGPLAGVLAALDWAAAAGADRAVTVPVDAPFLPDDFVARLLGAVVGGSGAAVARSGGRRHPVAALWPVAARHALRAATRDEGLRRVGAFLDRLDPVPVDWATGPFDPFANVNAPEDLAAAEALRARVRARDEGEPGRASRRRDDA